MPQLTKVGRADSMLSGRKMKCGRSTASLSCSRHNWSARAARLQPAKSLFADSSEPRIQAALEGNPAFGPLLDIQDNMLRAVSQRFDVQPTVNKYSDESGRFKLELNSGAGVMYFRTFSGPEVDWLVTAAAIADGPAFGGTPYVVVKTVIYPKPGLLLPIFLVEIGGFMPATKDALMYVCFQPVLNPFTRMEYLQRYYLTPPKPGYPSFGQLEMRCRRNEHYKYFSSPHLYNRMFDGTALAYTAPVPDPAPATMKQDCSDALDIWMEYLSQDCKQQVIPLTPEIARERDAMLQAMQLAFERDPSGHGFLTPGEAEKVYGIYSSAAKFRTKLPTAV